MKNYRQIIFKVYVILNISRISQMKILNNLIKTELKEEKQIHNSFEMISLRIVCRNV